MLLVIGAFMVLCVASSLATTTSEERAEAQTRFNRRWNPILIPLNLLLWALIIGGFLFPKR